jgi:PQQ-dependent dehydrogenase (methanol/ethanol family)
MAQYWPRVTASMGGQPMGKPRMEIKDSKTARVRQGLLAAALGATVILSAGLSYAASGNEWAIYGGDYANTRYSKLNQINTGSVKNLKVAWIHSLGSTDSQESTPLVTGGKMFVSTSAGPAHVFALDPKNGTTLWDYQPELPADYKPTVCCGLGNRGVAYGNGIVFVGRLDAVLVALDDRSGDVIWNTAVEKYSKGFSLTSPPLVVKNMVVTGHSGGEYGVRGSLQAYDQKTGKQLWKIYTIPGEGEPGNETWLGDSWKTGGGSPWYVGAYDPELNLIYYGTSNAAPWGGQTRGNDSSDIGPYTNLHTASQLAINPDTGKIVWHYQMTPSDVWDYDSVNEQVLVDLKIGGKTVPALLKADRNGFFYVLNRANGNLISAEPFVFVNWASHIDKTTGRPVENPAFRPRLDKWAKNICPNLFGGKNWPPMAFNPDTGLVYIPTFNLCMDLVNREQKYVEGKFYLAQEFDLGVAGPGDYLSEFKAWDPVSQKQAWGIKEDLPYLGGAMTTAGGLVFYGNPHGILKALDAKTGKVLWEFNAGSGINQSPITYMVESRQFIAVVTGRLKGPPSFIGKIGERYIAATPEGGSLIAFALAQ